MIFELTVRFNADNEASMAAFLIFIKDNHASSVQDASADSKSLTSHASLILPSLEDCIAAVMVFKEHFAISYKLGIK